MNRIKDNQFGMKTVFINPYRCIGCKQCQIACSVEHSQRKQLFSSIYETPISRPRIHVQSGYMLASPFPNKCHHCSPPPCLDACPTGAIFEDEGIILIDDRKCILCYMCAMVCPFGALSYHPSRRLERIVALKCDHCIERQSRGKEPACVETCKTGALVFGDINEILKKERGMVTDRVFKSLRPEKAFPETLIMWHKFLEQVSSLARVPQEGGVLSEKIYHGSSRPVPSSSGKGKGN